MPSIVIAVIAIVITLVISIPLTAILAINYHKKVEAVKLGNADEKAREIIDEALKTAETKKREALLEATRELSACTRCRCAGW